jgi:hypothetical protein
MGCGNNKVTRDYLTSQPVSTPSPRAAKALAPSHVNQVQRVISQVAERSTARARADAARAAKAAEAKRDADRRAAAKKAQDKKKELHEQREHERLRDDAAYRAAAFAPNQPTKYTGRRDGRERHAWPQGVKTHSLGFQYMTRADGMTTTEEVHVSTIAKNNGDFDVHLTDGNGRVATFDLTGADAADDLLIAACQEYLYDIMRDRERDS